MWVRALMAGPLPLAFPFLTPLTRTRTPHTHRQLWTPYLLILDVFDDVEPEEMEWTWTWV